MYIILLPQNSFHKGGSFGLWKRNITQWLDKNSMVVLISSSNSVYYGEPNIIYSLFWGFFSYQFLFLDGRY